MASKQEAVQHINWDIRLNLYLYRFISAFTVLRSYYEAVSGKFKDGTNDCQSHKEEHEKHPSLIHRVWFTQTICYNGYTCNLIHIHIYIYVIHVITEHWHIVFKTMGQTNTDHHMCNIHHCKQKATDGVLQSSVVTHEILQTILFGLLWCLWLLFGLLGCRF